MKSSLEIGLVLCCPTEKGCIPVGPPYLRRNATLPHRARGSAINYEDWCFANQSRSLSLSLSRESSTSETIASPHRAGRGKGVRVPTNAGMISQRNCLATYLTVLYGLEFTCRARASSTANRHGSSSEFYESCRFADLSAWLTRFFVSRTARLSDF